MRNKFVLILLISGCLFLLGCQETSEKNQDGTNGEEVKEDENNTDEANGNEGKEDENEGNDMSGIDIYDFSFIKMAPEAEEEHDINKVIKVYVNENDSSTNTGFAIDLQENNIYKNPWMSSRGIASGEDPAKVESMEGVIEILKKYDVQDWDADYTTVDAASIEDGYSWSVWMQYEDGTVEKHKGNEEVPEKFEEFVTDLTNFANGKLGES